MPHNRKTFYVLRALRLAIKQNFRQPGKIDFFIMQSTNRKIFFTVKTPILMAAADSYARKNNAFIPRPRNTF